MKYNKKIVVYMVLFVAFIAQVVFAKGIVPQNDSEGGELMAASGRVVSTADAGVQKNMSTQKVAAVMSIDDVQTAEQSENTAQDLVQDQNDSEDTELVLKVIYRNSLTSDVQTDEDEVDAQEDTGYFADKIISYCEERIGVYSAPDAESEQVGCMRSGSMGTILEQGDQWTKISSGDVIGYVKNTSLLFGEEAEKVAQFVGEKTSVVTQDNVPVFAAADATSNIIDTFVNGQDISAYDEIGNWVLVECQAGYGYVQADVVSSSYNLETAMTAAEEEAYLAELARQEQERLEAERQRQEAERIAAALQAQKQVASVAVTNNAAMSVSTSDEYLLACIIEWEAGWEPYEGKLAVANVVLNRVRSSRFQQNSVSGVIYAPGQFSGVLDGNGNISDRFATLLNNGPSHSDCYTAAREALSGVNNIGDYLFFISVKKANYSRYQSYTIINNHCFYIY